MSLVIDALSRVTTFVSIQGNIGAGKSTIFNALKKYIKENNLCALSAPLTTEGNEQRDLFVLLEEPVADWCIPNCSLLNSRGEGEDTTVYSYLSLFYKGMDEEYTTNPWGFDFQVNTFTKRLGHMCIQLERLPFFPPESNTRVHIISERSLRTDRLFFKNLYDSGKIPQHQWRNYEAFHDVVCRATLKKEDGMIYVKTSPEKCHDRIHNKRKREAEMESTIPVEYLRSLHNAHEELISEFSSEKGEESVMRLDFEHDMTGEDITSFAANLMQNLRARHQ